MLLSNGHRFAVMVTCKSRRENNRLIGAPVTIVTPVLKGKHTFLAWCKEVGIQLASRSETDPVVVSLDGSIKTFGVLAELSEFLSVYDIKGVELRIPANDVSLVKDLVEIIRSVTSLPVGLLLPVDLDAHKATDYLIPQLGDQIEWVAVDFAGRKLGQALPLVAQLVNRQKVPVIAPFKDGDEIDFLFDKIGAQAVRTTAPFYRKCHLHPTKTLKLLRRETNVVSGSRLLSVAQRKRQAFPVRP
jgi:hypothetical protein